ncbi:DUF11 domain-containing protein [Romboutsia sedimentorum]|uniref:DUF11 domain-containing protein n=1 Tax=Romboutsia sedimentorum TaxID=1368474 RepID=A0ABT7EA66_9FIRM|nr:DUF11 domain-containing protein [Romboutsia sedimentorum]MDK2563818.1 DUF11 domain-containing protein [Romboutsia sedimentorum]
MRVINECRIDFKYRLSPQSPLVAKTTLSNIVSTDIVKNILKIEKFVDKKNTYYFDILTYTIDIYNISDYLVTDVFFRDKIPLGTEFIQNSVEINNIKVRCLNPQYGFCIGDINSGYKKSITFKVVVLPLCFCEIIKNYSIIEHDYIYNIEKCPARVPIQSNRVYTKVNEKVFKQLSIDNILTTCDPILKIVDSNVSIEILQTKLVNTPSNDIYGECKSNICMLIVIGSIDYEMIFKSKFQKSKLLRDKFGFSCYMLVPVGIEYVNKNNIKIIIENASSNLINKNTVFINTNILLHY